MIDQDKFLKWCSDLFDEPVENLSLDTPRSDIEGWDSMGSLLLIADLDEIYGIEIGEEGILKLKTLADLAALVEGRSEPA